MLQRERMALCAALTSSLSARPPLVASLGPAPESHATAIMPSAAVYPALDQQRIKTTAPTKLTSLAQPMMFNDVPRKVPGYKWF